MEVARATDRVNNSQKMVITKKIKKHYNKLNGLTLTLWGLAFKPRTDDVREAPAFAIIEELLSEGVKIKAYDPVALENSKKYFGAKVEWFQSNYEALKDSDGLIIVTEWNEFRSPDFKTVKNLLKQPIIFDGRNIYNPTQVRSLGFTYYSMGRDIVCRDIT